jgi:hypothetical protein
MTYTGFQSVINNTKKSREEKIREEEGMVNVPVDQAPQELSEDANAIHKSHN